MENVTYPPDKALVPNRCSNSNLNVVMNMFFLPHLFIFYGEGVTCATEAHGEAVDNW